MRSPKKLSSRNVVSLESKQIQLTSSPFPSDKKERSPLPQPLSWINMPPRIENMRVLKLDLYAGHSTPGPLYNDDGKRHSMFLRRGIIGAWRDQYTKLLERMLLAREVP